MSSPTGSIVPTNCSTHLQISAAGTLRSSPDPTASAPSRPNLGGGWSNAPLPGWVQSPPRQGLQSHITATEAWVMLASVPLLSPRLARPRHHDNHFEAGFQEPFPQHRVFSSIGPLSVQHCDEDLWHRRTARVPRERIYDARRVTILFLTFACNQAHSQRPARMQRTPVPPPTFLQSADAEPACRSCQRVSPERCP